MKRTYLGDGLYASHDGFQFYLFAERDGMEHYVALESSVLDSFLLFIEKQRGVKFTVERLPDKAHEEG